MIFRLAFPVLFAAVIAAIAFLPLSNYHLGILTYAAVLSLFGLSLMVIFGLLGSLSFGHAAFFGLGAYTAGLLYVQLGVNYWVAALVAIAPGAALGALVGFASLRIGGAYFAIATLAVAEILRLVTLNWTDLTRGPLGIIVPRPRVAWAEALGLNFQQTHLIICVVALAVVLVLLRRLLGSPYARAWLATRDAPLLAESVGIPTLRYRILNTAISGAIAAIAGALLVPRILVLTPDLFNSTLSATGLLIAILGGKATLAGPVLGGIIFAAVPEVLRFIEEYRAIVFAILLLLVIRIQPHGLTALLPRLPRRRTDDVAAAQGRAIEPVATVADLLRVENISRHFGGLKAIDNVSLRADSNEIVGVIGPNGAGKTTCFTIISGFQAASSGRVFFEGRLVNGKSPHEVAAMGLIRTFQQANVCGNMTVFENVLIGTHLRFRENFFAALLATPAYRRREKQRREVAAACLAAVGLSDRAHEQAGSMPYGDQRFLSIAIALAAQPRLLLLDEPAAGLNHTEAFRLMGLLEQWRTRGLTILIIDHNLRLMMRLCDRIVVLHHGELLAQGTPAEIAANQDVIQAYLGTPQTSEQDNAAS